MSELDFTQAVRQLRHVNPVRVSGRVTDVIGLVIEGNGPGLPIGGVCTSERRDGGGALTFNPGRLAQRDRAGSRHRDGHLHRRLAARQRPLPGESVESGSPAIGTPQSGGLGNVVSGALELSNVAIAQEFIDLISTQRSFQAHARVITSSDALPNDLINIVR